MNLKPTLALRSGEKRDAGGDGDGPRLAVRCRLTWRVSFVRLFVLFEPKQPAASRGPSSPPPHFSPKLSAKLTKVFWRRPYVPDMKILPRHPLPPLKARKHTSSQPTPSNRGVPKKYFKCAFKKRLE